jgi:hypothetical protein
MTGNSKKPGVDSKAPLVICPLVCLVTANTVTSVLAGVVQITTWEGSIRKVFYIAQTLLDAKAPRFRRKIAISGSDLPFIIDFRSFSTQTFASFVKWLETRTLDVELESADHDLQPCLTLWSELRRYMRLHQFAEKYNIKALCDDLQRKLSSSARLALDASFTKNWFTPEKMVYVYECTSPGDSLRKAFAVAFSAVNSVYQAPPEVLVKYRKDFLIDVIVQTAKTPSDQQVPQETETQGADRQDDGQEQGEKIKRLD